MTHLEPESETTQNLSVQKRAELKAMLTTGTAVMAMKLANSIYQLNLIQSNG